MDAGWSVSVTEGVNEATVVADHDGVVVDATLVRDTRAYLERLAAKYNDGLYDGWAASV